MQMRIAGAAPPGCMEGAQDGGRVFRRGGDRRGGGYVWPVHGAGGGAAAPATSQARESLTPQNVSSSPGSMRERQAGGRAEFRANQNAVNN